jgi:hypothetical protein
MRDEKSSESEALLSFFVTDTLVPLRKLYSVASKETFRQMRSQGLKTYKLPGFGVCVRPSELKIFLDELSTT